MPARARHLDWLLLALASILPVSTFGAACKGDETVSQQDPMLSEALALPVGIRVIHQPNPVSARTGGPSGRRYTWVYETRVEAIDRELRIVDFRAFNWVDGHWRFSNFTGKPFTSDNFASWYGCPGARLQPGKPVADSSNWSGSDELQATKGRWIYIGEDARGNRYRGDAVVEKLAEVAPDK